MSDEAYGFIFGATIFGFLSGLTCGMSAHEWTKGAWERESVAIGAAEYVMTPDSKFPKWQWKPKAEKPE